MNIAICDDEPAFIDIMDRHLRFYLNENKLTYNIYSFTSGDELVLSPIVFDMAFLDVEMPGRNGFDAAKELKNNNPAIILFFITAFDSYLDDAFNLRAFRYLKKPIDIQRLYTSMDDALEYLDNSFVKFFDVASDRLIKLYSREIVYIETEGRNTKFITIRGIFHSRESISFWREKLTATYFATPHLSFIVNLNYVCEYKRRELCVSYNGTQSVIPVPAKRQLDFRQAFFAFLDRRD